MTDKRKSTLTTRAKTSVPLVGLTSSQLNKWLTGQSKSTAAWIKANEFRAKPGSHCIVADRQGGIGQVVVGIDEAAPLWSYAGLPSRLPNKTYRLAGTTSVEHAEQAALGWALGSYVFDRYKKSKKKFARLLWPDGVDQARVTATRDATFLVRDLINTPAEDMGPAELAEAAQEMAAEHGGEVNVIVGDKLLEQNYPAIHAVGRAASRAPRLVDLRWGSEGPEITLVGKGIVFDSGGLDLKPASSMKTMKKDMGGAAHVLGVAKMVMAMGLPIRLRVLIPAAENAVSGNAFRPLDVLATRKGLTVEVGNTDAEGRLVLADALTEAGDVDLVVDFATLTGAARVALGTDLPALFSSSDAVADALLASGKRALDELWRMPLYAPYRRLLDSSVADMNNVADGKYGGAITAALFLKEFVSKKTDWVHIDVMAYNTRSRPGRPSGGEAMGMRAVYGLIEAQVSPPTPSAV